MLDLHEWQQTFGRVDAPNSRTSFKNTELSMWENTKEYQQLGFLMAKNRKLLIEKFKQVLGNPSGPKKNIFTFEQGKQALDEWLYSHFGD